MSYPSWGEWLDGLDADRRAEAEHLLDLFVRVGADDPRAWTRSQMDEGIPQLARLLVLRRLWRRAIDTWVRFPSAVDSVPAARRLVEAGADRDDLVRALRAAAYEATFATLYDIGLGKDDDLDADLVEQLPGWRLIETDSMGEPTGRVLTALYEDLLGMDQLRDAELWE